MKLFHLSDLHIGKRFGEYSWIEDQKFILLQILNIIDEEKPDGIILAGDLYDKAVPSAEAVAVVDDFLTRLAKRNIKVFAISGNHDSAERVAYGGRLMESSGVYLSPVYNGDIKAVNLGKDNVCIYLLPFIKPVNVREFYPDETIENYNDAVRTAVSKMEIDPSKFNILVSHQFVTGAEVSDSEELSVGGVENVDSSVFDPFDYVALGHIHKPQSISRKEVRYCGTPLKYSFSECSHVKSITVLNIDSDKHLEIDTIPLKPKHDMRVAEGFFEDFMTPSKYEGTAVDDYLQIILDDEDEIPSAMDRLRNVYPHILQLSYNNSRTRATAENFTGADITKSELELFEDFYRVQNNCDMTQEQKSYLAELINDIWGY